MMPKQFEHPSLKKGQTEDLRHNDLNEAKRSLIKAIEECDTFYKQNPGSTLPNSVFGDLDEYMWELYNRKHMHHHFSQFGLVD